MKYTLIISFFVVLWTSEVHAADPFFKSRTKVKTSCTVMRGKHTVSDQIEYRFGVVAGRNIVTIKSKNSDSQDIILGLMGGVAMQAIWPKGLVLQPEILYSQKGCITAKTLRYDMDYVEVPVKVMYRLNVADVKPFAFVTPYGAYAFRLTESGERGIGNDVLASQINKWDFGIGAGAGFDVWKIQVSFKYTWGFPPVLDDFLTIRNKVFTVSAGLLF